MSAVFNTFAGYLSAGDHIISSDSVFGSTHSLFKKFLPQWNITTSYFSADDLDAIEALITPNTKIIFAESPTSP